jgi:hypothetical protein
MASSQLTRAELKNMLVEHLRQDPDTQFENIIQFGMESRIGRRLTGAESQSVLELVHEFITSNLMMPAMNRSNSGWPWLALTSHGREVLSKGGPPVYDYEGYLADLKGRVPELDEVVERYLGESLRAYQANLYHAAMVMLGCASERAIGLLIEAYVGSIGDETNREKLRARLAGRDISGRYERFKQSFDSTRNQIAASAAPRDFDAHVDGVFTFIRLLRNSIAHPAAVPNITAALVYANLQQFSYYVATIFELITYYRENKTTV